MQIKKIKHSSVTDDYIATEKIQNQKWKYFLESVLEVCKAKEIGISVKKPQKLLLDNVENITIVKKIRKFYIIIFKKIFMKVLINYQLKELKKSKITLIENIS